MNLQGIYMIENDWHKFLKMCTDLSHGCITDLCHSNSSIGTCGQCLFLSFSDFFCMSQEAVQ